jgi:hypothetical protein
MGTPKSSDVAGIWTAGASVYSGRVDPTWKVKGDAASNLMSCLEQLVPAGDIRIPQAPGLGFRGSWLRAPDGREWGFFSGVVQASTAAGTTSFRDPERNCERELLRTAPAGVLPPGLP